jgi:hypothetical protein
MSALRILTCVLAAATIMQIGVVSATAQDSNTNVWACRNFGAAAPEPIGDREGHALYLVQWNCRAESGPLAGGVATGDAAYEFDGPKANLLTFRLVVRKPGAIAVVRGTGGTLTLTMTDGKVTGSTSTGRYDYVLATGDWKPLLGKSETWVTKSTSPGEFSCESTLQ